MILCSLVCGNRVEARSMYIWYENYIVCLRLECKFMRAVCSVSSLMASALTCAFWFVSVSFVAYCSQNTRQNTHMFHLRIVH
jgi:hypothetical protein